MGPLTKPARIVPTRYDSQAVRRTGPPARLSPWAHSTVITSLASAS